MEGGTVDRKVQEACTQGVGWEGGCGGLRADGSGKSCRVVGWGDEGLHQRRGGERWRGSDGEGLAGELDDLHVFDPASMTWGDLSGAISGMPPAARSDMGMTAYADGKLYVFGGLARKYGENKGMRGWGMG